MTDPASNQLVTALVHTREALRQGALPLELPGVAEARAARDEMVDQLEDYVLPRLIQIDAPLLAVVGGSTGAGKSTLVNTLVGERVTETGVLRPTTRSPVLVHNPADASWFDEARILPDLERMSRASADPGALQLVASAQVPQGMAVLDAPDIDSVEERNRTLAAQLLAAADLWLFVTSAARYADQVPWGFLKQAADRSAAVAIVLNRIPPGAVEEVSGHLGRMLTARGLHDSPLFTVAEGSVDAAGLLPAESVREIRQWLDNLGADAAARAGVVRRTLEGAIRSVSQRAHTVADACAEQEQMLARLREDVERSYARAVQEVDEASADGTLLRGEVLARWQEFVGTGELLKVIESKVGWLRDRIVNTLRGRPQQAGRVTVAVESGLETLIIEHAEAAAERAAASWSSVEAGRRLLREGEDISRASRELRSQVERTVRDWQSAVLDMVRTEGADKRTTARFLAYGFNGLAVALMVVVFASTAMIPTGAEVGIGAGTAMVGQKVLEAVFGDQAVRRLAATARKDLERRVAELMASERRRFDARLDALGVAPENSERVRDAARTVDDVRFARRGSTA